MSTTREAAEKTEQKTAAIPARVVKFREWDGLKYGPWLYEIQLAIDGGWQLAKKDGKGLRFSKLAMCRSIWQRMVNQNSIQAEVILEAVAQINLEEDATKEDQ